MTPLLITHQVRQAGRTDCELLGAEPPLQALLDDLGERPDGRIFTGGEPTLRAELPRLLRAAGHPWLHTDALALGRPQALAALCRAGLSGVRVDLYSLRADAHDWFVGRPGSLKGTLRGLRACQEAGLEVEVELVMTRPCFDQLVEVVDAVAALGVGRLRLRRIEARGAAAKDFIAVSPRLALLQPHLEAAARAAGRVHLELIGVPACTAGSARPHCEPVADAHPGCASCPGAPDCGGAPLDYVERFGWSEIRSEDRPLRGSVPGDASLPPPRSARPPATRVRFAHLQVGRSSLGGDPIGGAAPPTPSRVCLRIDPSESSRRVRIRMAELAQLGARELSLIGDPFGHPSGPELLRDATRLGFDRVEAVGPPGTLPTWDAEGVRLARVVPRMVLIDPDPNALQAARERFGDRIVSLKDGRCGCGAHAECPSPGVGWHFEGAPVAGDP